MDENLMNTSMMQGQSIMKPPYFDGTNTMEWKERMKIFLQSVDFKLWLIMKNGPKIPKKIVGGVEIEKSEDEFDEEDMNNMEQGSRAKNILYRAVNPETFQRISKFKTAKEMWDEIHREVATVEVNSATTPQPNNMAPNYNQHDLPIDDFLRETREAMRDFFNLCVPLYKHALEGNWEEANLIIAKDERLKHAAITSGMSTVLHIVAGAGEDARHTHFVQELLASLEVKHLSLKDSIGNTAFCFAAATGNMAVVKLMLEMDSELAELRGAFGFAPVQLAALQVRCDMTLFLYNKTKRVLTDDDLELLFFTCINTGNYGLALKMATEHQTLAFKRDENEETALHLLARSSLESCCQGLEYQDPIINSGMKRQVIFQLVKFLWQTIIFMSSSKAEIFKFIRNPSHMLFDAAEVGNFGFLSELISAYPSLIWEKDSRDQTIIHIAVTNRHASIYNLIREIGSQKDVVVTMTDTEGNTLLHLAAKRAPESQLELVSGAAFQMCLELVWFKEVQKIMSAPLVNLRNSEERTASELFRREHAELRNDAESWMKSTAQNCMLISTVIATGVFSASITIPGGLDDKSGKPNYLKKPSFLVFVISDATAFISSAAAILIFLSILVSRYAEYDFYKSLPLKLIFGLVALFCSITSMMVAFASAFFITYYYDSNRVPIFISAFAFLPILLFIILQFSLWCDIMYSTFYCKNIFKPGKTIHYVLKN